MRIALLALAPVMMAQSLSGPWHGMVNSGGIEIPFRFEIAGSGTDVKGTFFNGDEQYTSTSGRLEGGSLMLKWEYFAAAFEGKVENGAIDGIYSRARSKPMQIHLTRGPMKSAASNAPRIDGLWWLENVQSSKGESAWHFIVKQKGGEAAAAILRVDGDTGTLNGSYDGSKFVLSHFSGLRPALLEVTPNADGTLKVVQNGKEETLAYRPDAARSKGLPEPTDPSQHTGVKNASEPFRFSFPDLNGKTVSDSDPRFTGKVVLINVMGSWCPNCHDEAPFLAELYKKYRAKGLEIVALSFEEADQLKDPTRLRAFLKRYGIDYTVLLCGDTSEAKDKLSSASNWDAWPTTFFVGRDGKSRGAHTGFPSKASAELYTKAKEEFTAKVERLLAESALSLR